MNGHMNGGYESSPANSEASQPEVDEANGAEEVNELAEAVEQPRNQQMNSREASRLTGTVKWFNAKSGYGFITRNDTGEDVFVHFTGIARKNPRHSMKSLGDGEIVEFNVLATNVTGQGGRPVRGNPYVSYLPVRRYDFASGDPPRYVQRQFDVGNSRIPRWNPNWQA